MQKMKRNKRKRIMQREKEKKNEMKKGRRFRGGEK